MPAAAHELLYEKIKDRDRFEHSLCDTTDLKASILLVVITFLATLAGSLLIDKELRSVVRLGQVAVIIFVAIGGLLSIVCLWPRDYSTEKPPQDYEEWLSKLTAYFAGQPDAESKIANEFKNGEAAKGLQRIKVNYPLNRFKLRQLYLSFWFDRRIIDGLSLCI